MEQTLTTKVVVADNKRTAFAEWQATFHKSIALFPGFVSLEFSFSENVWSVVQRFQSIEHLNGWKVSRAHLDSLKTLQSLSTKVVTEEETSASASSFGVTEVFVTEVLPGKSEAFRECVSRIHAVESQFPGFRGMYIQAPTAGHADHWITLLQFDTQAHLDGWLSSKERQEVLRSLMPLIRSLENHRVISPFAGWFSRGALQAFSIPAWKQTMLVLFVLFPIVMLEIRFLQPITQAFNRSVATFIANAISVTLVSWPLIPLVVYFLNWWLQPNLSLLRTCLGIALLLFLYLLEITLFS